MLKTPQAICWTHIAWGAAVVFIVVAFASLPIYTQQTITGEVVGVKDGDTIEVLHGGRVVSVRLHGIDTPGMG